MLEKVKDLFYDISDILLSILIIAVMFYTISWKLSDTMSYTPNLNLPFLSSQAEEAPIPTVEADESTHVAVDEKSPSVEDATNPVTDEGEVIDMAPDPEETAPTPQEEAKPESESINVLTVKEVSFIVPSGTVAYKIIQQLEDQGLIDDKSAFTTRLSERKLDSKLRSGTFQLSSDMTYDQIINKLTGQ